jgi:anti-sigma-K factor RskA
MNYGDPTLREHLAAEYVLGTLRGRARRRFERLLAQDAGLRDLVRQWEARLNPLAERAPAVAPPPQLWARIEARLGAPASRGSAAARRSWIERLFGKPLTPVPSLATAGLWYCVGFWRALGIGGATVAAALALYLTVGQAPAPFLPSHVAVLAGEAGPTLVARLDAASGHLALTPVALPPAASDTSLELWILPPGGAAPRSLGLLTSAGFEADLPPADIASLAAGGLAVSLEPAGGSPTGQPTGPVLYHGPILPAS